MTSALRKISEEEYLRSEETSPFKREYVDGFVYPLHAQAGATGKHGMIAANLVARLHSPARKKGCFVFASDRREKLWAYQSLPSVQAYLLVDTELRAVRLFTRSGDGWSEGSWEGELTLPCVDVTLTLAEVYEGTRA